MKKLSLKYSKCYKYLLRLLSSVILNIQPPKPNKEIDWALVFHLAKQHSVFGMLSYAVEKLDEEYLPSQDMLPELKQIQRSELILESNIQFETEKLIEVIKKNDIDALLLKGMVLKEYYPVPSMRSMSDVDILYKECDKSKVKQVLKEQGYKLTLDFNGELNFIKPPFHHYEFHPCLTFTPRNYNDVFYDVWDNPQQSTSGNCMTLSLANTYVYMLEHLAKHIEKAGAGLRMVMDVFVFLRKEQNNLNSEIINRKLEELKLKEFSEKIITIAQSWFGSENPDTESTAAQFILGSCTFGITDNAILQSNIRTERRSGKKQNGFKYIIRKIFPEYKHICARFSSAKKLKLLYPFYIPAYWCLRLFKDRNVKTSNIGKYFVKTDSDEALYLLSVMEELKLSSRI